MSDQIRDRRRNPFILVDSSIIKEYGSTIGPYGIAVYCVLVAHADGRGDGIFPSRKTIAEMIDCSIKQVDRKLAQLVEVGLLAKEAREDRSGRQTSNLYTLLEVGGTHSRPGETHSRGGGGLTVAPEGDSQSPLEQEPQEQEPQDQDSGGTQAPPAQEAAETYSDQVAPMVIETFAFRGRNARTGKYLAWVRQSLGVLGEATGDDSERTRVWLGSLQASRHWRFRPPSSSGNVPDYLRRSLQDLPLPQPAPKPDPDFDEEAAKREFLERLDRVRAEEAAKLGRAS